MNRQVNEPYPFGGDERCVSCRDTNERLLWERRLHPDHPLPRGRTTMAPFPALRARTTLLVVAAAAVTALLVLPVVSADNGKAPATLSFFSGGGGAHADWFATE